MIILACMLFLFFYILQDKALAAQAENATTLGEAMMCEGVYDQKPVNPTIVFPVSKKNAFCFTDFPMVKEKSYIYHKWYRRDRLITKIKLEVLPPRWSVYSNISFREVDKGPWRIDITDSNDDLLKTLRFSVTDE